ncbi:MAG: hypothetical protein HY259_01735 [Chloroflexi bacterium]|nr:hypothetical protein [Chloroflexota bacterium]
MNQQTHLMRWLTIAALADWLIARTVTRSAIFMPKSPPVLAAFEILSLAAPVAVTLAGLLALAGIIWLARRLRRASRGWLSYGLSVLAGLSLLFIVVPSAGWLAVVYHLLVLAVVALISVERRRGNVSTRVAGLSVAAALVAGELYQLNSALSVALRLPEALPIGGLLFNLGEACVVASTIALWRAYGRGAGWRVWLGAALLALAFSAGYLRNPEMTGVLAIWSIGLTLYLPWPLYAIAIALSTATIIQSLRRGSGAGWAILLFAAGGYAPQFSSQVFLGLIGLWLLNASSSLSAQPQPSPDQPEHATVAPLSGRQTGQAAFPAGS